MTVIVIEFFFYVIVIDIILCNWTQPCYIVCTLLYFIRYSFFSGASKIILLKDYVKSFFVLTFVIYFTVHT